MFCASELANIRWRYTTVADSEDLKLFHDCLPPCWTLESVIKTLSMFEALRTEYRSFTRAVGKVSSHFEYLENWSRGLDVTWQPIRGDLTVHP